ncbi:MAG: ABC transporter, permease protein 1 (cluster 1, maltose/g3p/polyamine/iron) [uncultured Thermomicrobiales bacterium]|uniref:ABC transporter, permease protein 1 (Cluster 1, maltose/g3p/polyamine/iron) n=1 Tax=uncultured Thermomicrobiales bacterium TaxID=1645740 RepID=A0A6J4U4T4_9BACT|nr:MAG: ABC transporter, permease protein 1 (cluster 1, maltose/g3p/polyamine/iron) [uncultured Thermomicrobiales bacterium]
MSSRPGVATRARPSAVPVAPARGRRRKRSYVRLVLLLPAFVSLAFVTIYPLGFTVYASLTDWNLFNFGAPVRFVGFRNWIELWRDQNFLIAFKNTAVFVLIATPLTYLVGLMVAVALDTATVGKRFFRVLFWLPLMLSSVLVTVVIGRMMFDPFVGPVDSVLDRLGVPQVLWLANPRTAMMTIIILQVWWGTAYTIMLLVAALESLPPELNEAARVDGAGEWRAFWEITFPLLLPVSSAVFLIQIVDAWKVFDIINVLTGGGPGTATQSISLLVFQQGVQGGNISYASAMAWMLTVTIAVVAGTVYWLSRRWTD